MIIDITGAPHPSLAENKICPYIVADQGFADLKIHKVSFVESDFGKTYVHHNCNYIYTLHDNRKQATVWFGHNTVPATLYIKCSKCFEEES